MTDKQPEQSSANMASKSEQEVLAQVQKLMNLAASNPNEHEAAAAAAKAQDLLIRYNLSAEMLEQATATKSGKREKQEVEGGFYRYSRRLWWKVAELNFCLYWTQDYYIIGTRRRYSEGLPPLKNARIKKHRHALVGKIVNVQSTIAMATYLTGAIERVLSDRLHGNRQQMFTDWAHGFRTGAIERMIEKLAERREAFIAEERREQMKREAADRAAGRVSTATGLTVVAFVDQEHDANMDFIMGEGWSAKKAAERAERAAERARREAEYTEWAKANPEEAAAREAQARSGRRKASGRRSSGGSADRINWSAYYSGYDAAEAISLDPQMNTGKQAMLK